MRSSWRYDLLHEGWISCVDKAGQFCELGILEVLKRAHELAEIIDSSPLVVAAIVRLFEAVLLESLPLKDEDDWVDLWAEGRFSADLLAAVEGACTGRMDLFDESQPFFQSCDISATGSDETTKSVGSLFPEVVTGTAVTHYTHGSEDAHAFCEACCAKGLVSLPAFATSGGQGIRPSINGVPPLYVLPMGGTLFETLLLNYVLPDNRPKNASHPDAGPFWRSDGIAAHKDERLSAGFMESLTWPARRVRLLEPHRSGFCSRCGRPTEQITERVVFMQGWLRSAAAPPWRDPWAAFVWRKDKEGTLSSRPLRPAEHRSTWRDTGALFMSAAAAASDHSDGRPSRPAIVDQLEVLLSQARGEGLSSKSPVHFLTVGIRTDMKAKVFEWRSDRFEFPGVVLGAQVAGVVSLALEYAETVAEALARALLRLHADCERQKPSWGDLRKAMADVVGLAQGQYWRAAEPIFRTKLFDERLAGSEEKRADWLSDWHRQIAKTVWDSLEEILAGQDDTADALRRQEAARRELRILLKKGEPRDA